MTDLACTCCRHTWNPTCPRHGRSRLSIALVAIFYVVLAIAVVLTAHGAA